MTSEEYSIKSSIPIEKLRDLVKISNVEILESLIDELSKKYTPNRQSYIVLFIESDHETGTALLKVVHITLKGKDIKHWALVDIDTNDVRVVNDESFWKCLLKCIIFVIKNPVTQIKVLDKTEYLRFLANRYEKYAS